MSKNISDYCALISQKYNLDAKSLLEDWENMNKVVKENVESSEKSKEITIEMVNTSTVPMLTAMCAAKGLKKTGKKDELILRLLECLKNEKNGSTVESKTQTVVKKSKEEKSLIMNIKKNIENFPIKKNSFGNFEHLETHLVFSVINNENVVTGVQKENGEIFDLTTNDIDLCHKFKFKYILPKNLNSSKSLEDCKNDDPELDDPELDDPELDDPELDDEELEDEI